MKLKVFPAVAALIAGVLVLAGCGSDTADSASATASLKSVKVGTVSQSPLPWIGYYVADKLGFYKEEGFKVEIIANVPGGVTSQAILNKVIDFGGSSTQQSMSTIAQAPDAKLVYAGFDAAWPFHISVLADSPIKKIADLKGKAIGVRDEGDTVGVTSLLADGGLSEGDYTLSRLGQGGTAAASLVNGTVNAMYGTSNNEDPVKKATGTAVRRLGSPNFDKFVNSGLMGPMSKSEDLGKLARAIFKAWVWVRANPESALDMLIEMQPAAVPDRAVALATLNKNNKELNGPQLERKGAPPEDSVWAAEVKLFTPAGAHIDPASIVDTSALKTAWSFQLEKLEAAAKANDPKKALGLNTDK